MMREDPSVFEAVRVYPIDIYAITPVPVPRRFPPSSLVVAQKSRRPFYRKTIDLPEAHRDRGSRMW